MQQKFMISHIWESTGPFMHKGFTMYPGTATFNICVTLNIGVIVSDPNYTNGFYFT